MSSSVARAVQFVELAIVAREGTLVVDGVSFTSAIDAELARHALAERAVGGLAPLRYVTSAPRAAGAATQSRQPSSARDQRH